MTGVSPVIRHALPCDRPLGAVGYTGNVRRELGTAVSAVRYNIHVRSRTEASDRSAAWLKAVQVTKLHIAGNKTSARKHHIMAILLLLLL